MEIAEVIKANSLRPLIPPWRSFFLLACFRSLHNWAILPHYTTLHRTILHQTTLHYTTLHCTILHYTSLHYTTQHYTWPNTALHYTTLHNTTQHYTPLLSTPLSLIIHWHLQPLPLLLPLLLPSPVILYAYLLTVSYPGKLVDSSLPA